MEETREYSRVFGYSVNKLIDLVRVRPVIWDSTRADFRSFNNKEYAWREVYEALDSKYLKLDERRQMEVGIKITAKWRNIRDAFIRSYKKRAQHSKVKKYMHHDRLSFMLKLLVDEPDKTTTNRISRHSESTTDNVTEGSVSVDDCSMDDPLQSVVKVEPDDEEHNYSVTSSAQITNDNNSTFESIKIEIEDEGPTCSKKESLSLKRKLTEPEDNEVCIKVKKLETETQDDLSPTEDYKENSSTSESVINALKELENVSIPPPDEDEAFFASILSFVKDMNDDEKLEFRMSVLQLIHGIRLKRRSRASQE